MSHTNNFLIDVPQKKNYTTDHSLINKILFTYGIKLNNTFNQYDILVPYLIVTDQKVIKVRDNHLEYYEFSVLVFTHSFISSLENYKFEPSIKTIIFGNKFNQSLDCLPEHIEIILFLYDSIFNNTVNNLPVNMQGIIFGRNFKQSIDLLPPSIKFIG